MLAHFQVWLASVSKTQQRAAVSHSLARLLKPWGILQRLRHCMIITSITNNSKPQALLRAKHKAMHPLTTNPAATPLKIFWAVCVFNSTWPRIGSRQWQAHNILHNAGSWAALAILLCIWSHIGFQGPKVQNAIGPQVPNFRRVSSMLLSMCEPTRLLLHCYTAAQRQVKTLIKPGNVVGQGSVSSSQLLQKWLLSELVWYDSVSTVAFKFQAHHLFYIFKFDVQEVGLGTTWQVFRSFSWILVIPF